MQIIGNERSTAQALIAPLAHLDLKLRWGRAQVEGAVNGRVHLLNGFEQLTKFREAGVAVPEFTQDLALARQWAAAGYIVLGRSLWHTQGKDIVLPSDSAWAKRDYWVKYWGEAQQEWRFHILYGRSIGRGTKRFTGAVPGKKLRKPKGGIIVRSRRMGWTIDHQAEPPEICRSAAKAAARAVGYELGAVDLLYGIDTRTGSEVVKVLEINSRPAIRDNYTVGQYTKYLEKWTKSVRWKAEWGGTNDR